MRRSGKKKYTWKWYRLAKDGTGSRECDVAVQAEDWLS